MLTVTVRDPFYTSRAWRAFRLRILDRDGWLCQMRTPGVCTVQATTVNHIIPRSVAPDLSMDESNNEAACRPCNSHDGGKLGRLRQTRATRAANSYADW